MIQAPAKLTLGLIQRAFGRLLAAHGESLSRLGAVELKAQNRLNASEIEIQAQVLDGRKTPFQVQLYYQPEEDWALSGDCTCSAATDCKHCAAVAFAWMAHRPIEAANDHELENWLKEIQSHKPEVNTAAKTEKAELQLCYLFEASAKLKQCLQLGVGLMRKARGNTQWHFVRFLQLKELLNHEVSSEKDQEFCRLLLALNEGQFEHSEMRALHLRGHTGFWLYQELIRSGKSYWQRPHAEALAWGPEKALNLQWEKRPAGYQLQAWEQAQLYFMGKQGLYLDSDWNLTGPVAARQEQLQALKKAPVVSASKMGQLSRKLLALLPDMPLAEPLKQQEKVIQARPQAQLLLYSVTDNPERFQDLRAELQFNYGPQTLKAYPREPWYSRFDSLEIIRVQRDLDFEQVAEKQLLASGMIKFQATENVWSLPHDMRLASNLGGGDDTLVNWHYWLHHARPELISKDWKILVDPGFEVHFLRSNAWHAEFKSMETPNIFDLQLGVDIDGEKLNLLNVILQMMYQVNDPKALRAEFDKHDTWLLPIPKDPLKDWAARSQAKTLQQRWLEVPTRRLARIFDMMIELYDYLPDEPVQVNPQQLLQIQSQIAHHPDDYGVHWNVPQEIKEKAQALVELPSRIKDLDLSGFQGELRHYQKEGVAWLNGLASLNLNGILADEMGLGKTLQTLALLQLQKHAEQPCLPALIVVPTSVLPNWVREAQRFTPQLKLYVLYGPDRVYPEAPWPDVIVTTYALYLRDQQWHQQQRYSWLILDEAQTIKNPRAKTARALCAQASEHRLCLSGTPMENNLQELWSLYHFLMPGFLGSLERFQRLYRRPIENQGDTQRQAVLKQRLKPFLMRRRKQDVAKELPPKTEIVRLISLNTAQQDLYETLRVAVNSKLSELITQQGLKRSRIMVLDALLKLRQICCDPQLLDFPEAQKVKRSAKKEFLMQLLDELLASGRRVLVFSQFVQMLRRLEIELDAKKIPYLTLTGQTRQRQALVDRFQNLECPLFLISLKAGGVGLNLTAADTVIHYDPWWNPASQEQASDRAWRIGQDKAVFVYKLISAGTVEEYILNLQSQKKELMNSLFSGATGGDSEIEQLWKLLRQ